jgi:hypothetical protein
MDAFAIRGRDCDHKRSDKSDEDTCGLARTNSYDLANVSSGLKLNSLFAMECRMASAKHRSQNSRSSWKSDELVGIATTEKK